jgi:hypothetical protein
MKLSEDLDNEKLYHLLTLNETSHDLFAQAVGPCLHSESLMIDVGQILETAFFIPLVLHMYVDIQNQGMEKYYEWMVKNSKNSNDRVFSASVLSLNNLYAGNLDQSKYFYELTDQSITIEAPVLVGRIALLKWVFTDDFDNLIRKAKENQDSLLYFSIDVIPYMVFHEKIEALKSWFICFPKINIKENTWVEKEILFFYNLGRLFAFGMISELQHSLKERVRLLNSRTTFEKIYTILEKRYLNWAS